MRENGPAQISAGAWVPASRVAGASWAMPTQHHHQHFLLGIYGLNICEWNIMFSFSGNICFCYVHTRNLNPFWSSGSMEHGIFKNSF